LQIAHNWLRWAIRYAEANGTVGRNMAGLIDTRRTGGRSRSPQAAVLIDVAARSRRSVQELHGGLKGMAITRERRQN